jgi:tetratricopeptide (TPR) repeat protein
VDVSRSLTPKLETGSRLQKTLKALANFSVIISDNGTTSEQKGDLDGVARTESEATTATRLNSPRQLCPAQLNEYRTVDSSGGLVDSRFLHYLVLGSSSMKKLQLLIAVSALVCGLGVSVLTASTRPQFQRPISFLRGEQDSKNSETDDLIRAAYALYRQGKLDEALADLNKAAALSPSDFRPLALSGYVYSAQHKLKSASEAFAAAIRLQPAQKELYLAKAEADSWRNAHDEALAACRKATEVDPNYAEAYAMIGDLLRFNVERRAEAIAALRSAIRLNPKLPQPYAALGSILAEANDEKGAEEVFRQGMAADPEHMGGRFELGRLLVKQGRLTEAREIWEGRTSDEDRTSPRFIELLTRAENLKRATDSLAKQPKDPDALIEMGLAVMDGDSWVVDGRQERAIVYFKQALALKPDSARAQYSICKAYVQIADTFSKENKVLNEELAKLRKLDAKLAGELEEYRKNYKGGIIASPIKVDQ